MGGNEPDLEFVDERGSIAPLLAFLLGLGLVMALAVGGLGSVLQRRAHAQAAADAVALALAGESIDKSRQVALANGVTIVSTSRHDRAGVVVHVVEVEFGGLRATAAASLAEDFEPGG